MYEGFLGKVLELWMVMMEVEEEGEGMTREEGEGNGTARRRRRGASELLMLVERMIKMEMKMNGKSDIVMVE